MKNISKLLLTALIAAAFVSCEKQNPFTTTPAEFSGEILTEGAVDMGLSVKWAACNLAANTPDQSGEYFAWGEIETMDYFHPRNCKWAGLSPNSKPGKEIWRWNKYCGEDNLIRLLSEDDAATVKLGEGWRTPTREEFDELIRNCTWTWTAYKGVQGMAVKSNINGNTIFLPASCRIQGEDKVNAGFNTNWKFGFYWTSELRDKPEMQPDEGNDPNNGRYAFDGGYTHANILQFWLETKRLIYADRYDGLSIRPVFEN